MTPPTGLPLPGRGGSLHRITGGLYLALVLSCVAACSVPDQQEPSTFSFGDWAGGFGQIDGDRPHWAHITVSLRLEGPGIAGTGVYLAGPADGRLSDRSMRISGRAGEDHLSLQMMYGAEAVSCDAGFTADSSVGTCRVGTEEVILRLVRVEPYELSDVADIKGVYAFGPDRRILVNQIGPLPTLLELPSGEFRVLFHRGGGRWTAGPRFLVGYPEEWQLDLSAEAATLRLKGSEPESGKRRPASREEEFAFASGVDGITLRGTLTLPASPGPHPAIVWVHGSGYTPRSEAMFFPQYFSDLGFAVLAYDKRGVGASDGTYAMPDGATFNVPFLKRRGGDVAAAMEAVRRHPDIAAGAVGLAGISQAGWVMPVAASSTECAFTITMSGGATPLSQEDYFSALTQEQRSDVLLPTIDEAIAIVRARPTHGYDWSADFAAQRCPGLWLYGLNDRSNPSQLAIEVLEAVKAEHAKDFTIIQFPEGNHPLMQSSTGGASERLVLSRFVPGKFTAIEEWLAAKGFLRR